MCPHVGMSQAALEKAAAVSGAAALETRPALL